MIILFRKPPPIEELLDKNIVINSIEGIEVSEETNSLIFIFKPGTRRVLIDLFVYEFNLFLRRENGEKNYYSARIILTSYRLEQGTFLMIDLTKSMKGQKIIPLVKYTDSAYVFHRTGEPGLIFERE